VVGAHALHQLAHHHRRDARVGDGRLREELPHVGVHVGDAELLRDLGQVGDPVDAAACSNCAHASCAVPPPA
jgi:hypothetical protein